MITITIKIQEKKGKTCMVPTVTASKPTVGEMTCSNNLRVAYEECFLGLGGTLGTKPKVIFT